MYWILLSIDRSTSVPLCGDLLGDVLDDVPHPVLDHATHARRAGQHLLVAQLDAFLPFVLDVREADQVSGDLAFRIEALVFVALIDAGNVERGDLVRDVDRHLTLDVDETLVFRQLHAQFLRRHAEELAELVDLVGIEIVRHRVGNRPDRAHGQARREHRLVTVENLAARRRQIDRALVAAFALLPIERVAGPWIQNARAASATNAMNSRNTTSFERHIGRCTPSTGPTRTSRSGACGTASSRASLALAGRVRRSRDRRIDRLRGARRQRQVLRAAGRDRLHLQ